MLTALQERFARAYVGQAEGNAAEAVRIAGSSASTPDSRSSLGRKWLTLPEVKERIQALRDSAAQTQLMDRNRRSTAREGAVQAFDALFANLFASGASAGATTVADYFVFETRR